MTEKLNLGCGQRYLEGWVNLDASANVRKDVGHNLNQFPYPFEDNSFDEILCQEVMEHLEDVVRVMEEIHRIARPGAVIKIIVPHYSCSNAYTDPTHRRFFGYFSFDYFTGDNSWGFYSRAQFAKVSTYLKFYGRYKNYLWEKLANRWPRFYEEHLAWILPAWYASFELKAVKQAGEGPS